MPTTKRAADPTALARAGAPDEAVRVDDSEWQRKGATLSDKAARAELGLTQDEIVQAIGSGALQYRRGSMHGNPFLRLLRREVEAVAAKLGDRGLKARQAKAELARVDRELRRLETQVDALEARKAQLMTELLS